MGSQLPWLLYRSGFAGLLKFDEFDTISLEIHRQGHGGPGDAAEKGQMQHDFKKKIYYFKLKKYK